MKKSVYKKQPDIQKINHTLAILSPRKIDVAHCIRFKNKYIPPMTHPRKRASYDNYVQKQKHRNGAFV